MDTMLVEDMSYRAGNMPLAYSGGGLDRAAALRRDPDRLTQLRASPDADTILFHGDAILCAHGLPLIASPHAIDRLGLPSDDELFLGIAKGRPRFARDLSDIALGDCLTTLCAHDVRELRALYADLPADLAGRIACGRGLSHWHRNQRFCGRCGSATTYRDGGHRRQCEGCGRDWFPRIEPAAIVVVESPDRERCLLARHRAGSGTLSTLAGFVEVGESLEDAARREVLEEVGIELRDLAYVASQAWPFPAGLMVGFIGCAETCEFVVDGDEVIEARWLSRAAVRCDFLDAKPSRLRLDSIEATLLRHWANSNSQGVTR